MSVDDWREVSDTPRQFRGGFAAPGSFQCFIKHQNRIHGKSQRLPLLATSHIAISDGGLDCSIARPFEAKVAALDFALRFPVEPEHYALYVVRTEIVPQFDE